MAVGYAAALVGGCLVPDSCLPLPPPAPKGEVGSPPIGPGREGARGRGSGRPTPRMSGPGAPLPRGAVARLGGPRPGQQVRGVHNCAVTAVAQSPRVGMAATGGADGSVGVWKVRTGELISWIDQVPGRVNAIAFSPNSRVIVTGRSRVAADQSQRTVHLWEVTEGRLIRALVHYAPVLAVAQSPNGGVFVTGGQLADDRGETRPSAIRFWDISTGELLRESYGHRGSVRSLSYSGDGQLLASGGDGGEVRVWDPGTGEALRTLAGQVGPVRSVVFSPRGNLLASSDGQSLWIWNLASGLPWIKQRLEEGELGALAFFPSGKYLASGGDKLRIWSASSGAQVKELAGHQGAIRDLAVSSDGRLLVTGSADRTALVWKFKLGT